MSPGPLQPTVHTSFCPDWHVRFSTMHSILELGFALSIHSTTPCTISIPLVSSFFSPLGVRFLGMAKFAIARSHCLALYCSSRQCYRHQMQEDNTTVPLCPSSPPPKVLRPPLRFSCREATLAHSRRNEAFWHRDGCTGLHSGLRLPRNRLRAMGWLDLAYCKNWTPLSRTRGEHGPSSERPP